MVFKLRGKEHELIKSTTQLSSQHTSLAFTYFLPPWAWFASCLSSTLTLFSDLVIKCRFNFSIFAQTLPLAGCHLQAITFYAALAGNSPSSLTPSLTSSLQQT